MITFPVNNFNDSDYQGAVQAWEAKFIEHMKNYTNANLSIAFQAQVTICLIILGGRLLATMLIPDIKLTICSKIHGPDFPTCGFDFVKVSSRDLSNCNVDVVSTLSWRWNQVYNKIDMCPG